MSYINQKVKEIINSSGDIIKIKRILYEVYATTQMDSSIRKEFDQELDSIILNK